MEMCEGWLEEIPSKNQKHRWVGTRFDRGFLEASTADAVLSLDLYRTEPKDKNYQEIRFSRKDADRLVMLFAEAASREAQEAAAVDLLARMEPEAILRCIVKAADSSVQQRVR